MYYKDFNYRKNHRKLNTAGWVILGFAIGLIILIAAWHGFFDYVIAGRYGI